MPLIVEIDTSYKHLCLKDNPLEDIEADILQEYRVDTQNYLDFGDDFFDF